MKRLLFLLDSVLLVSSFLLHPHRRHRGADVSLALPLDSVAPLPITPRTTRLFLAKKAAAVTNEDDDELMDMPEGWKSELLDKDKAMAAAADDDDDEAVVTTGDDDDDEDDIDVDEVVFEDEYEYDEEEEMEEEEEEDSNPKKASKRRVVRGIDDLLYGKDDGDWYEEEDGITYELEDNPDDPNFVKQKELIVEATKNAQERQADRVFDPFEYLENKMTPEMRASFDKSDFMKRVQERSQEFMLTKDDLKGIDIEKEVEQVSDMLDDDPYPSHTPGAPNFLGVDDDDMIQFDETIKDIRKEVAKEPWDKVMVRSWKGFEGLTNDTIEEIDDCLHLIAGSCYNVTNWLLYDLDFNVSNLILAAVQHNPDAPILFQHWYPQLVTYQRYQHARDRDFDFNWDDVEKADLSELERYYAGFGYDEIPEKAPAETGIIGMEYMDEEEMKMAAFESWVKEVYNPEADKFDFDEEGFREEDNVFSDIYEHQPHPDFPTFEEAQEDIEEWERKTEVDPEDETDETREYRNKVGQLKEYKVIYDEEFQREFRGHLIIACTSDDADLEVAEKITARFEKEFGKAVFVETRVMALAREEDNVFEIWLESYEIDLLHSKKRATGNVVDWDGPADVDDAQLDYLTERVRFLISDDSRYSHRMNEEEYAT